MTHGFKNGRLWAEQGTVERTGVGEFLKFDDGTDNFQTFSSDGSPEGVIAADKGSFAHDITNGCVYYKTTDTVATGWVKAGATVPQAEMKQNLGFTYAAGSGTFTVRGSNASLSASNPAYVTLQSKSSPGDNVLYTITADQSFIDDNGTSEIVGNLFGATTSIAWDEDVPFYLYAVGNDDENTIAFMISRNPAAYVSPAAASIGAPDDAVADSQTAFFSLENIDESLYDSNPCLCLGSFRMQMSASDDWTVQTLTNNDGIGKFQENVLFSMPRGQNGAASGSYIIDNGGTEPEGGADKHWYSITKGGRVSGYLNNDITNTPSGAQVVKVALPYVCANTLNIPFSNGYWLDTGTANKLFRFSIPPSQSYAESFFIDNGLTELSNATFASGDAIRLNYEYQAFV